MIHRPDDKDCPCTACAAERVRVKRAERTRATRAEELLRMAYELISGAYHPSPDAVQEWLEETRQLLAEKG